MSTVAELIASAMRLAGLIESGSGPTAQEQTDALEVLNSLLASWMDDGIQINDGDLILSEEFPVDPAETRAVRYALAVELYPEYSKPVSEFVARRAEELKSVLLRKYAKIPVLSVDRTLENIGKRRYDINTDL